MRRAIGERIYLRLSEGSKVCLGGIVMGAKKTCPSTVHEYDKLLMNDHIELACENCSIARGMVDRIIVSTKGIYRQQLAARLLGLFNSPNTCRGVARLPNSIKRDLRNIVNLLRLTQRTRPEYSWYCHRARFTGMQLSVPSAFRAFTGFGIPGAH
jgi:hypothetical protein